jgi:hypothetical protein
MRSSQVNIS